VEIVSVDVVNQTRVLKPYASLDFIEPRVLDFGRAVLQLFLPHTFNGASRFGNHFIPANEYRGSSIDFSNTPLDFFCPRFVNLSLRGSNESRQLLRETNSLTSGKPHLGSPDAFIRDHHARDATSEGDV
jgi:hypothetical protein